MRYAEYEEETNEINGKTRSDIIEIIEERNNNIFGLKLYNLDIIEDLENTKLYNFSVDMLFKNENKEEVKKYIDWYNKNKNDINYQDLYLKLLEKLEDISIYNCVWR